MIMTKKKEKFLYKVISEIEERNVLLKINTSFSIREETYKIFKNIVTFDDLIFLMDYFINKDGKILALLSDTTDTLNFIPKKDVTDIIVRQWSYGPGEYEVVFFLGTQRFQSLILREPKEFIKKISNDSFFPENIRLKCEIMLI